MSLKEMFKIPESHSLVEITYEEKALVNTSYEEKDSMAHGDYWTYEERDDEGRHATTSENGSQATESDDPCATSARSGSSDHRSSEDQVQLVHREPGSETSTCSSTGTSQISGGSSA